MLWWVHCALCIARACCSTWQREWLYPPALIAAVNHMADAHGGVRRVEGPDSNGPRPASSYVTLPDVLGLAVQLGKTEVVQEVRVAGGGVACAVLVMRCVRCACIHVKHRAGGGRSFVKSCLVCSTPPLLRLPAFPASGPSLLLPAAAACDALGWHHGGVFRSRQRWY